MTDMASNHGKITRVFPRRTAATPEDPYAFTGPPPCGELPDISEVHISVTFTYDMQKAERLADMWSATGLPVRMGGPAFCEPGGAFVPGPLSQIRICNHITRMPQPMLVLLCTKAGRRRSA